MPRALKHSDEAEPLQPRSRMPLNTASPARFLIGRDATGCWVVQDRLDMIGGLFASETAAVHFAREACDHNPADVCIAPANVILGFRVATTQIH